MKQPAPKQTRHHHRWLVVSHDQWRCKCGATLAVDWAGPRKGVREQRIKRSR